MKIIIAHNYYQQSGGEDVVYRQEIDLLKSYHHQVISYDISNLEINDLKKGQLALKTIWNKKVYEDINTLVRIERPEIVHFHNTFPLISPAGYFAAKKYGGKVVQTLHNFRLICPSAILFRNGSVCEDCVGKFVPYPGIYHACYRDSYSASSVTAVMLAFHKFIHTWDRQINGYIALTEFSKNKFIQGGLPREKIYLRPNYLINKPNFSRSKRQGYIYAGRLSIEKGINVIFETWRRNPDLEGINIIGTGPLLNHCLDETKTLHNVRVSSWVDHGILMDMIQNSRAVIYPSVCYETFGMALLEAFSTGTPVIASNHGAMAEIIQDGKTGLLFAAGDWSDLAIKVRWASEHPAEMAEMGKNARAEFEARYTADKAYDSLMDIYEQITK